MVQIMAQCQEENVLTEFMAHYGTELIEMLFKELTREEDLEISRLDGYDAGQKDGFTKGETGFLAFREAAFLAVLVGFAGANLRKFFYCNFVEKHACHLPAVFSQKVFDQALLHTLFYRCIDGAFQITAILLGCCFDIVQQLAVAQKRRTSLQDFVICIGPDAERLCLRLTACQSPSLGHLSFISSACAGALHSL